MKIGIMQPYLFPYLGYFQLINFVDLFVIYDDVQYIKGGWINRNKIKVNDRESYFSISVKNDSTYKNINERYYSDKFLYQKEKFLKTLQFAYKKAPYFDETYNLVKCIFDYPNLKVSEFNSNSIKLICDYTNIKTNFIISSNIDNHSGLKAQERLIYINKCLNSSWYINAVGGIKLYSRIEFEKNDVQLNFIKMKEVKYNQFGKEFINNLSIIDVLMFNSKDEIKELLNEFELT
ncbi:WbqC family protein [Clostridium hydrogenum]|uniref:WbqC family protein n=1 Tax=Clostridium hydrogenum TaxID=2855764 RepID=UPI001F1D18EC|nr:WbqC family protein [Clostridium hydrogenum]